MIKADVIHSFLRAILLKRDSIKPPPPALSAPLITRSTLLDNASTPEWTD